MIELVLTKNSRVSTDKAVPFQCKEQGHTDYDYEIEITTGPFLDENDFIIDHTVVHNVIRDVVRDQVGSCERICLRVQEALSKTLKEHGCALKQISLAIKPVNSNAWVKLVSTHTGVLDDVLDKRGTCGAR